MFKESKNPVVIELTKTYRERQINLGELKAIVVELPGHKSERRCAWCTENKLDHGNQKYCSQECSDSAMAWAYPQKENAMLFLLMRQDWKCFKCQYDYKPFINMILAREGLGNKEPLWYHVKRMKAIVPRKFRPEVDHIIPISKGGQSIGLDNHQVICYLDHKVKTKIDNSGPRKK